MIAVTKCLNGKAMLNPPLPSYDYNVAVMEMREAHEKIPRKTLLNVVKRRVAMVSTEVSRSAVEKVLEITRIVPQTLTNDVI